MVRPLGIGIGWARLSLGLRRMGRPLIVPENGSVQQNPGMNSVWSWFRVELEIHGRALRKFRGEQADGRECWRERLKFETGVLDHDLLDADFHGVAGFRAIHENGGRGGRSRNAARRQDVQGEA